MKEAEQQFGHKQYYKTFELVRNCSDKLGFERKVQENLLQQYSLQF